MKMNHCYLGDCRDVMRDLIAQGVKVQCVVTSPPYWGLRDYGVEGQIGLESSLAEYVKNMVEVFDLVLELLADDGTLWLNLGDSYASSGQQGKQNLDKLSERFRGGGKKHSDPEMSRPEKHIPQGLKPKDLCGVPWRVAFALQESGWYLRQDIIWHKPNPMPESVTDRCTKAHEYLFLLTKSKRYWFDAEAIKDPVAESTISRLSQLSLGRQAGSSRVPGKTNGNMKAVGDTDRRNKRSVWTVATHAFKEAHFATFPPALVEPCILAGSRPGDIVFDPFMGSGTVAQVAQLLGRQWLGSELNPEYIKLQSLRTQQGGLVLGSA